MSKKKNIYRQVKVDNNLGTHCILEGSLMAILQCCQYSESSDVERDFIMDGLLKFLLTLIH